MIFVKIAQNFIKSHINFWFISQNSSHSLYGMYEYLWQVLVSECFVELCIYNETFIVKASI